MSEIDDKVERKKTYQAALAEANAESALRKRLLKQRATEINSLKAELDALRAENGNLSAKLEKKPDDLRQELEEAKVKLRTVLHKAVFEKIAKQSGANETAIDDLYAVSGYKAESDEIDEVAIRNTVDAVLSSKPYFKAQAQPQAEAPKEADPLTQALQAGLGLSRGSTTSSTAGFVCRESEVGSILGNPAKRDEYLKAYADKTLTLLPG